MKKYLLILSVLLIVSVLFFEVSHVVIVLKFGQGHEITIGKAGTNATHPVKLLSVLDQESVAHAELVRLLNGNGSEKQQGIRNTREMKPPTGSGGIYPWLFVPRFAIGYPAMNMSQLYKPDYFYSRPVDQGIDHHQEIETNYATQQQATLDIQAILNPTVRSNFMPAEWMTASVSSNQANNINSEKEQYGVGNLALQQQYGLLNVAVIHQVGNNNVGIQSQNGLINVSSTLQAGSMNVSIQEQNSRFNTEEVIQSGILNKAKQTQNQESPGSLNTALSSQGGAYNSSLQHQNGSLNIASTIQTGLGNVSVQYQEGNANDALIAQASFGNEAHQSQSSSSATTNYGNHAEIYQSGGSGNYAEQTQEVITGDFINSAVIRQQGSSNFARQAQAGDNTHSIISQTGRNNNSMVSQVTY